MPSNVLQKQAEATSRLQVMALTRASLPAPRPNGAARPPAASRGEASAPTPLSCSAKFPAYVIVAVDRRHARWSRSLYSGPLTLLQGHCFSGSRHSFREGKKRGSFFKVVTLHSVSSLIGCAFLDRPGFTIWRTRVEGPRVNIFTL